MDTTLTAFARNVALTAMEIATDLADAQGTLDFLQTDKGEAMPHDAVRDLIVDIAAALDGLATAEDATWATHDWVLACEHASAAIPGAILWGPLDPAGIAREAFDAAVIEAPEA